MPRLATLAVAVAAFVATAETARGGCEHPAGLTRSATAESAATTSLEILLLDDALQPPDGGQPSPSSPRPCSGPHCKEQSAPVGSPVLLVHIDPERGCLAMTWGVPPAEDPAIIDWFNPLLTPTLLHIALERPPRAS